MMYKLKTDSQAGVTDEIVFVAVRRDGGRGWR